MQLSNSEGRHIIKTSLSLVQLLSVYFISSIYLHSHGEEGVGQEDMNSTLVASG